MRTRNLATFCIAALLAIPLAACSSVEGSGASSFGDACTSDAVIYGCIDIEGRVSTPADAPLEGVDVGPTPGTASFGLTPAYVNTGADGHFELRLFKTDPSGPNSMQLSLKATVRNGSGAELRSKIMLTQVTVTAPEDTPDPVTVNFVIAN